MILLHPRKSFFDTPFNTLSNFIDDYLDLALYAICFRCAKERNLIEAGEIKRFHHCGRFNTHISGNITPEQVTKWEQDVEHGLFHGFSTSLIAGLVLRDEFPTIKKLMSLGGEFLRIKEKNLITRSISADVDNFIDPENYSNYQSKFADAPISFEQVFASCLLHDFAKCNGVEDGHDAQLSNFFPNLDPVTYSHASPENHKHPLLISDVLELKRFPDHHAWYRPEIVEPDRPQQFMSLITCYYDCVRPALEMAYRGLNEPWLRHGPEVVHDFDNPLFPQHPHEWFPIEIDRLPFTGCFDHDWKNETAPWAFVRGILSFDQFKRLGGVAKPHQESYRDHLFAKCESEFKDWAFVIDRRIRPKQTWTHQFVRSLIDRKHKVIDRSNLYKFARLITVISDRIKINNC